MQLKRILILASSDEDLHRLEDQLRDESDWHLTSVRVTEALNGTLRRAFAEVDLALVCCRSGQVSLLEAIDALPEANRPRVLVCGDLNSPEATRLLVRIGVVDLLSSTPTTEELQATVRRALREVQKTERSEHAAEVISVFSASGGAGASIIAGSLAHLVAESKKNTLLIDLDLIYAPIEAMFGLHATRGIVEAIRNLDSLDATALDGYIARHDSGLHLLSSVATGAIPTALDASHFARLLDLCQRRYDYIFIAANRWLDSASVEGAAASHHVLVVLSQSLADVRHATRLRQLLTQGVGVPDSILRIILNKYSTRSPVKDDMISKAIGATPYAMIPDDGPLVRRSLDSGVPIAELDRHSPMTEALIALEGQLLGTAPAPKVSPVRRMLATLSRGER